MTTVAERRPTAYARAEPLAARALGRAADWLELYSGAAVRIAYVGAVLGALTAAAAIAGNVFTRYVLGYSLEGSDELANFAFLWTIWMGVSLAVKRSAVTVITLASEHGPLWWRRSVKAFSGISLGVLLVYCCIRATQYATHQGESLGTSSPGLGVAFFYPIASMAVGYYFITLHYAAGVTRGAAGLAARGREGAREVALGLVGAAVIGGLLWAACYGLLAAGASK